jgi:hypothetical protein
MRLITAHKILIGSAAAFFVFFAVVELRSYQQGGGLGDLLSAAFGLAVAAAFALYLRALWGRQR